MMFTIQPPFTSAGLTQPNDINSLTCAAKANEGDKLLQHLSTLPQSNLRQSTKRKSVQYQDVLTESPYL